MASKRRAAIPAAPASPSSRFRLSRVSFLRAILLGAGLLIGFCAAAGMAKAKPVEVTLMLPPNDLARPAWEQLNEDFNRTHDNIKLRILWSDPVPKMNLLTVAGALPDLLEPVDFSLVLYHDDFIDMDTVFNELPGHEQYYPTLVESCKFEGKLKTIPMFYNVPFIYYRPDLFRKAGLPEPSPHWTWDEYRHDAKVLTEYNPDGSVKIWGTSILSTWWAEWLGLIRQAGGDLITPDGKLVIDSPGTAQAAQFMHDLIYVDKSASRIADQPPNGFISGRMAIYYGGHVLELDPVRKNYPYEWDVAPLPAGPCGQVTGELAVVGLGLTRQCQHPQQAIEVLKYLVSEQSYVALTRAGQVMPVRRDVVNETVLADPPDKRVPRHLEAIIDSVAFARSVPKLKAFTELWTTVNIGLLHMLNDPDPAPIKDLPAKLGAECRQRMENLEAKTPVNPLYFVLQLVLIGGAVAWWMNRYLTRTKMSAEEKHAQKYFFLFSAPCIVGLCLFTVGPLLLSFWWAQTDYDMMSPPRYVGFAQYHTLLFSDPDFWHSLYLSLIYAVFAVPLGLVVSLATALLLNQNLKHIGIFRVIFYLPSILPVAASTMMWLWLLNRNYGVVNQALSFFHIRPGWLQDPNWAMPSLVLISVWGFGGGMLIFLAGLKNIPESLYEAAEIDGAGPIAQFFYITLPSLSPVIFFNLIIGCIAALQVFDIAYIVSTATGGVPGDPERSTYFYVLNLYMKSFATLQIGVGSAMAWVFFFVILALTGFNFWAKRYWFAEER